MQLKTGSSVPCGSPSSGLHPHLLGSCLPHHSTEGSWYKRLVNVLKEENEGKRERKEEIEAERRDGEESEREGEE